jgi:energy-coupling factor transporter ATP-binding protein EcfA2
MALELTGITVEFRTGMDSRMRALEAVDLRVDGGRLTLVMGATGSGKTTLMRAAAGLLAPDAGTVTVAGSPLPGPAAVSREFRVGLVFQDPETQLFAETVLDDVAFGPRNLKMSDPDSLARDSLARVGLSPEDFADRSPFALSGGQARRVAIAGVLAMDPAYLLLDEPTAGLDAVGSAAVVRALCAARDAGVGVAVVTHDPEELLDQADSVVILSGGRVAYEGPAAALVADPTPLAAAGLLAPDVLRLQSEAVRRGADMPALTLDTVLAADALAAAVAPSRGPVS